MTKEEFESWYKGKKEWLRFKARHFLEKTNADFNEANELISLTLEEMLYKLPEIKTETVDSWVFFTMKNLMHNKLLYHTRRFNCCDNFEYFEIPYVSEQEVLKEEDRFKRKLRIIKDRAKTPEDKLVVKALSEGKPLNSLGIDSPKVSKIMRKLKGLSTYDKVAKDRKPKIKKKKEPKPKKPRAKKGKLYISVAKMNKKGKILKVYDDVMKVVDDGFNRQSVYRCYSGRVATYKGFIWKLIGKNNKLDNEKKERKKT